MACFFFWAICNSSSYYQQKHIQKHKEKTNGFSTLKAMHLLKISFRSWTPSFLFKQKYFQKMSILFPYFLTRWRCSAWKKTFCLGEQQLLHNFQAKVLLESITRSTWEMWVALGYCWWLKSGDHQLRLVVYPIIYRVSAPSKRWFSRRISSEPSTVGLTCFL